MPVNLVNSFSALLLAVAVFGRPGQARSWEPPEGYVRYSSSAIPNRHIVQYHDGTDPAARRQHEAKTHIFALSSGNRRGVIKNFQIGYFSAYHGELDADHVEQLRKSPLGRSHLLRLPQIHLTNKPQVKAIHPDSEIRLSGALPACHNRNHTRSSHPYPPPPPTEPSQLPAVLAAPNILSTSPGNWGQARLSHRLPPSSSSAPYIYERSDTTVYIIDSGIHTTHWQFLSPSPGPNGTFTSRAMWGANFMNDNNTDESGHGTHVAGIIGGRTFGIAPNTRLVALKVFAGPDSKSSWSAVMSALEWACKDTMRRNGTDRSVINMSLGGGPNPVVDDAVRAAMKCGITVVIASGNNRESVENCSPARVKEAITVGSIGEEDQRSSFSNFGEGVDIFAPGENILSSWRGGEGNSTQVASGTSMASPFVAGLAAYVMDLYGPREPKEMKNLLEKWATKGRVQDARGSADRIAFNGNREERG